MPATPIRLLGSLTLLCASVLALRAQELTLRVGVDRWISADEPDIVHVEPHVVVWPDRPERILVGAIVFRGERMSVDVLATHDGGTTWSRSPLPSCMADPWLQLVGGERVLLGCVGHAEVGQSQLVYRSADGGVTWTGPTEIPRDRASYDHVGLAVDAGSARTRVYAAGMMGYRVGDQVGETPFLSWSDDAGVSFAPPTRLEWSDVSANVINPVVLPDGRVGIGFVDFAIAGRPLRHRRIWWTSWDPSTQAFSLPRLAAETGARTLPQAAAVRTAEGVGRVLIPFDDDRDGAVGIVVAVSEDGGAVWQPVRPLVTAADQNAAFATPVITADRDGRVAAAWYERPPGAEPGCWRIQVTASVDAGSTFASPVTVSSEAFCVGPQPHGADRRWPAGGDYFGLTPAAPGRFRIVWADTRSGPYQLRTNEVTIERR